MLLVSKDSSSHLAAVTVEQRKRSWREFGSTQSDMVAGSYTLAANTIDSLLRRRWSSGSIRATYQCQYQTCGDRIQGGELQLHSQQSMTIGSESGQVNLSSPKRIKEIQTSAGASITIDDSGIKLVCPGTVKIKAVRKEMVGGAKAN